MFKGAFISRIGYFASAITSGNEGGSFSARGFGAALITGAVSAGLSSGIGKFADGNGTLFQTAAHGVVQGGVAFAQGGSFETGFATGMFGSIAAGGGGSAANMIGSAAFVGGMTTLSGGGSFWRGAAQGGIVAGFNHVTHEINQEIIRQRLNKHRDRAVTLDEWTRQYSSSSLDDIQNEAGGTFLGSRDGGPKIRYVINPVDNNVMDMRHVMVVGYKFGYKGGNLVEKIQAIFKQPSAYDSQDYYSNFIGASFRHYYSYLRITSGTSISGNFSNYFRNYYIKHWQDAIRFSISKGQH